MTTHPRRRFPVWPTQMVILSSLLLTAAPFTSAQDAPGTSPPGVVTAVPPDLRDFTGQPLPQFTQMAGDSRISMHDDSSPEILALDRAQAAKLATNIPSADFVKTPFRDVIDIIRRTVGLNIVVDSRALEAEGVDPATPINLHLSNLSCDLVLQWLMNTLANGRRIADFEIQAGAVFITTADELQNEVGTRVYDVKDVLSTLQLAARYGPPGMTGADALARLIQNTVYPESWRDNGGQAGSLTIFGTELIVTQSRAAQIEVVKLLNQVRHPSRAPD